MRVRVFATVAALALAAPAFAQYPGDHPYGDRAYGDHGYGDRGWDSGAFWRGAPDSPRERIQFLQDRIDRGVSDGSLDRHEADRANRELNNLRGWIRSMHWDNGGRLTPDQRARVQERLDSLSRQIHWMRHNDW
ncbi:MAG: hypothetical protein JO326_04720 [Acetobacteraceae bacterium]|nr:hypothetical protein [Acetobacteraceae bacterium]